MKNKLVTKKLLKGVSLSMATVVAATTVGTVAYADTEQANEGDVQEAKDAISKATTSVEAAKETEVASSNASETLVENYTQSEADIAMSEAAVNEINRILDNVAKEEAALKEKIDAESTNAAAEALDNDIAAVDENTDKADQAADEVQKKVDEANEAKTRVAAEAALAEGQATLEKAEADVKAAGEKVEVAEAKVADAENLVKSAKELVENLAAEGKELSEEYTTAKASLEAAKAELEKVMEAYYADVAALKAAMLTKIAQAQKIIMESQDLSYEDKAKLVKALGDDIVWYLMKNSAEDSENLMAAITDEEVKEYVTKEFNNETKTFEDKTEEAKINELLSSIEGVYGYSLCPVAESADSPVFNEYYVYMLDENGRIVVKLVTIDIVDDEIKMTEKQTITSYVCGDKVLENEESHDSIVVENKGDNKVVTDLNNKNNIYQSDNIAATYGSNFTEKKDTEKTTYSVGTREYTEFNKAGTGDVKKTDVDKEDIGTADSVKNKVNDYLKEGYTIKIVRKGLFGTGWFGTTEDEKVTTIYSKADAEGFWNKFVQFFDDLYYDYDVVVTHTEDTKKADAIVAETKADFEKVNYVGTTNSNQGWSKWYDSKSDCNSAAKQAVENWKRDTLSNLGIKYVSGQDKYRVGDTIYEVSGNYKTDEGFAEVSWKSLFDYQYKIKCSITTSKVTVENKTVSKTYYKADTYAKNVTEKEVEYKATGEKLVANLSDQYFAGSEENIAAYDAQLATLAEAKNKGIKLDEARIAVVAAQEAVDGIQSKIDDLSKEGKNASEEITKLEQKLADANKNLEDVKEKYQETVKKVADVKEALSKASNLSRFVTGLGGNDRHDDKKKNYGTPIDTNTNVAMVDTNLMNIDDAAVPMAGDTTNTGRARRANTTAVVDNTEETILDEEAPKSVEKPQKEDKASTIDDEEAPKAAEQAQKPWWILILIALGLGGVATYFGMKKKNQAVVVENSKNSDK